MVVAVPSCVFASSGNWVEVTRFNGTIWRGSSEQFTCDHVDWRIKWRYEPNPTNMSFFPLRFSMNVVEVGGKTVNFFIPDTGKIGGTLYINQTGKFYISVDVMYVDNYSIIVEQNLDAIPEFPSWIILPFILTYAFIVVIYKKKLPKIAN